LALLDCLYGMTLVNIDLGGVVKQAWQRFQDEYEPLRPQLYRYCRHLTGSAWDAEDMAQDAMARAFVTLGCMDEPPRNPRAWLFRVASNLWINHARHVRDRAGIDVPEIGATIDPRPTREAAGTLLAQLSPQERAAVVLKDVFDLSLAEIAEALSTTPGAIKAALHRGRGKLEEPATDAAPVVPAVLDAFCDAFNARDVDRLTALLLDASVVELPGLVVQVGPAAARAGILRGTLFGCPDETHDTLPPMRSEVRAHRGESLLLWWWGDEVDTVVRVVVDGEKVARLTSYYHAPDVLAEVCGELGVPHRTHGYRIGSAR
jgi:RNA polymerase sigma-70 factor (ECF subfamily)